MSIGQKIKTILTVALLSVSALSYAQRSNCYWVRFADKSGSPYSVKRPWEYLSLRAIERRAKYGIKVDSTDLPVNPAYVDTLRSCGFVVLHTSRWMNGATIMPAANADFVRLRRNKFVESVECTLDRQFVVEHSDWDRIRKYPDYPVPEANNGYGNAYDQIKMLGGDWLHRQGFTGEGVRIAVIDGGFFNVDGVRAYSHVWNGGRLIDVVDLMPGRPDVFNGNPHGGQVLSVMAGVDDGRFVGTAPDASYMLLRSEDDRYEAPVEMDNFIAALEIADSAGVDVITASLGYSSFDDGVNGIDIDKLDGMHYRISIAEGMAVKKGIFVVNSVGNKGATAWRTITVPSDAKGVMTVGAVGRAGARTPFSSYGPTADGRFAPLVCALGRRTAVLNHRGEPSYNSGTSLAAPLVAGLSACLMQAFSSLSPAQLTEAIISTASKASSPDDEVGYGIADFHAAYLYIQKKYFGANK